MKKLLLLYSLGLWLTACNNDNGDSTSDRRKVRPISSPATDSCGEPYLFSDSNGVVYLSWLQKVGDIYHLKFATGTDTTWSQPIDIASGRNWFVNWADYPVIASDGRGSLIAHYLEKSDSATFSYDVKIVTSPNSGKTWSNARVLHDDGLKAEHGFVSIVPANGRYFASWLDGRETVAPPGKTAGAHHGHHGQMTLRGAFISPEGEKQEEWLLDNRVCDCCQTSATITSNGPVVVYRDRSDNEIRDIGIVRYADGKWLPPQLVFNDNWEIKGCPVNGPRVDAVGNNVAITWFSMKGDSGYVNCIFSRDGGATFTSPIAVNENKALGRLDLLMTDSSHALISWMEGAVIKAAKISLDGTKESSFIIAESSESRSSGFPQMARAGKNIFFAWTDNKSRSVKTAVMSLAN
jgi:hypothetical protein